MFRAAELNIHVLLIKWRLHHTMRKTPHPTHTQQLATGSFHLCVINRFYHWYACCIYPDAALAKVESFLKWMVETLGRKLYFSRCYLKESDIRWL